MNHGVQDPRRGDCLSPTKFVLLANPLEFIHEDHLREREICAQIDALVSSEEPNTDALVNILTFLRDELPLHLEDEEEDLFPLLRRRCEPEDEIGKAIKRLTSDHRHADNATIQVIADLETLSSDRRTPSPDMRVRLAEYAGHARRHLILENAIVLPFARLRLTTDDLETLRLRMIQRRGVDRLTEKSDAQ